MRPPLDEPGGDRSAENFTPESPIGVVAAGSAPFPVVFSAITTLPLSCTTEPLACGGSSLVFSLCSASDSITSRSGLVRGDSRGDALGDARGDALGETFGDTSVRDSVRLIDRL